MANIQQTNQNATINTILFQQQQQQKTFAARKLFPEFSGRSLVAWRCVIGIVRLGLRFATVYGHTIEMTNETKWW